MNILFITYTRIGDAVLSTGLLSHLIDRYPTAAIKVACGPAPAGLFSGVPNVEQVLALPKRRFAGHWRQLWAACVGRRWDVLVDLRNSAMPYVLRAKRRYVLGPDRGREQHRVERLGSLLDLDPPPAPRLWIDEARHREAEKLVPDGEPVLALGPTANWLGKQWPAANFSELARRLTDAGGALSGARVAIFGAPNERAAAGELIEGLPSARVIDLVGTEDLLTVAACLQRATLFVGNDSGLMHMAAAVGTRTVGLFGPSREEHYAPWGVQCAVVRTPESYDDIIGAPGYDHRTTGSLMGSLSVEAALAAAVGLIQRESAAIS